MCIMVEVWSTCMLSANKIDLIIIGTKQSSTEQAHKPLSNYLTVVPPYAQHRSGTPGLDVTYIAQICIIRLF